MPERINFFIILGNKNVIDGHEFMKNRVKEKQVVSIFLFKKITLLKPKVHFDR